MNSQDIKSFEDACKARNIDPTVLPDVSLLSKEHGEYLVNMYKLAIIVEAINGDWVADFGDHDQRKYFPWFYVEEGHVPGSASGFSYLGYAYAYARTRVGSRLCFSSSDSARHAGEQFRELYEKVHLITK